MREKDGWRTTDEMMEGTFWKAIDGNGNGLQICCPSMKRAIKNKWISTKKGIDVWNQIGGSNPKNRTGKKEDPRIYFIIQIKGLETGLILSYCLWCSRDIYPKMPKIQERPKIKKQAEIQEEKKEEELTNAEKQVCGLISQGLSNPEIAEKLFVSQNTVRSHLKNIYRKLNISNRTKLVLWGL